MNHAFFVIQKVIPAIAVNLHVSSILPKKSATTSLARVGWYWYKKPVYWDRLGGSPTYRTWKSCHGRVLCHDTIYILGFWAKESWRPEDNRCLFYACCDEMADVSLLEAMQRLLTLVMHTIGSSGKFSDRVISSLLDAAWVRLLISYIHIKRAVKF